MSDLPLVTALEKKEMAEKMRLGINMQVQAKDAESQEEKGTSNLNVAAGPTADEVRTLISDSIKEMEWVGFLQSVSDHPMF